MFRVPGRTVFIHGPQFKKEVQVWDDRHIRGTGDKGKGVEIDGEIATWSTPKALTMRTEAQP